MAVDEFHGHVFLAMYLTTDGYGHLSEKS